MGYLYRYSYFNNIKEESDGNEYFQQSENAHSNFIRLTVGAHFKFRTKNLYINPYVATMYGYTRIKLEVDTSGGSTKNYDHDILPRTGYTSFGKSIIIMGVNFCFDLKPKARKPDNTDIKKDN
jgi:outer membrane autotransporter protein